MKIDTLDKAGYRKFGVTMAIVIALLFGLFFPWAFNLEMPLWPWVLSGILLACAVLLPNVLAFVYKPWMIFGHYVGIFNTKLILTVVFFVVFAPVALVLMLLGKDAMKRKFKDKSVASYWKKSHKQNKDHMEKVY